jgi:AraC-like DNA-binding protein
MNSEFQVHPAQIQGTIALLQILDDILHSPLEGVLMEEYQYALLRTFSREVLYRMANSCIKVGRIPSGFPHESEVLRAASTLDENLIKPPSVPNLAKRAGSNPTTLRAGFKSIYGESIRHYTSRRRLQVALQLLCSPYLTETDIARQSGYGSASAMVKAFNRELGGTPGSFKIAKNMLIGTTTI